MINVIKKLMLIIKTKITALGIVQRKDNMAILSKDTTKKMTIDLTGPNGNAFTYWELRLI